MINHAKISVTITQQVEVDADIADEIVWLNEEGVRTEGSCSGHGEAWATALITPSSAEKARELGYEPSYIDELGLFTINLGGGIIESAIKLQQIAEQEYTDATFRAGLVEGHKIDTIYFQIKGENKPTLTVLLRTDEALALNWVLTGTLWSEQICQSKTDNCR